MRAQEQASKREYYSLDRFEGEVAVLLQGRSETLVARNALPPNAKEGQLFSKTECGTYQLEHAATEQKQAEHKARIQALLKRTKRG